MKTTAVGFAFALVSLAPLHADLTLVQKVEGGGQGGEMVVKIKGDKARIEGSPNVTTLIDGKTGEMTNLMNDRKTVVRISAEKMRAAAEMVGKFNKGEPATKAKLTPTGKKETVGPYETEQYVCQTPSFKATYWLAPNYPNGAAILKELQSLNPQIWGANNMGLPDYRDFPALPIKTTMSMGQNEVTTTLVAIKQDPLNDAEFEVPKDFREIKLPEINLASPEEKKEPASATSPKP